MKFPQKFRLFLLLAGALVVFMPIRSALAAVPQTPSPTSPADGQIISSLTPTLRWTAFKQGGDNNTQNGYQVRVRSDSEGDAIIYDTGYIASTSGTSHTYSPGSYSGYDSISSSTRVSKNLVRGKHYHWHVRYRDSSGDWGGWSGDTPTTHQDFIIDSYPVASILAPANNATVSGTVNIKVEGYDYEDPKLSKVEYYIDGVLKYTDNNPLAQTPASTWNYNTSSYSNAAHTIKIIGYDSCGLTAGYQISVTVKNNAPPTLTNTSVNPSQGGKTTKFTYYATYTDPENTAPSTRTVNIDGSGRNYTHNMTYASGNYNTGAVYKYETTLAIATHSFYFYFVDGDGKDAMTSVLNGPTVKNQAPDVSIVNPANGTTVSGTVTIKVEGVDPEDGGLKKIEYYIDGFPVYTDAYPLAQSPASTWKWDTSSYNYGSHTIRAKGYDSAGTSSEHQISVTVSNNRQPSLSNPRVEPAQGSLSTKFTYYVTYTDLDNDAPLAKTINIDASGGNNTHDMTYVSGNYNTGALYKYETTLSTGVHSFYCYFTDTGTTKGASTAVIDGPTVKNQAPQVSITAPANGVEVSGTVSIKVDGIDPEDGALKKIEYYIDGALSYTDNKPLAASPASKWSWDTTFYSNGTHTIKVKGYDSGGLTGENQISVKMNNQITLAISSFSVDDDSKGSSNGNGNGKPDAGETIELHVLLKNTGLSNTSQVQAVLNSLDPNIAVTNPSASYGNIGVGEVKDGLYAFVFKIPDNYAGTPSFKVDISANNGAYGTTGAINLPAVQSKASIKIRVINQDNAIVSKSTVYVNGTSSGSLQTDGTFLIKDLNLGCYRIQVKDDKSQSSDITSVYLNVDGEVKSLAITLSQTVFFNIGIPTGLIFASGEKRGINISTGIEASEPGNLYAYLYDNGSNLINSTSVHLGQSGSFFKTLALILTAPQAVKNYQYSVRLVFDPDSDGTGNTTIDKPLYFDIAPSADLIEWVKIINDSGQELNTELYKFEVLSHQIQVKTKEPAVVKWGTRTFETLSAADNVYYYNLSDVDFTWGQWDQNTPGTFNTIIVNAKSSNHNENRTISIECRATPEELTGYSFFKLGQVVDTFEKNKIDLSSIIRQKAQELAKH